ncbi:MAG: SAM-dependent methyltransferase, partial [Verrucomicrobiales bacterium]|nr:SAM-dependent methyltransferase [Verrucomicrobiales bacterium]
LLRLTRYLVVFEVYNPYSILQLSEVLSEFRIVMADKMVYSGRAVVSNLVNTGIVLICEATLDESWLDVDLFTSENRKSRLEREFTDFIKEWEKIHRVESEFKVVVADMQILLMDLRRWLEQVELGIRSEPTGNRNEMEKEAIQVLQEPILPMVVSWFDRFDTVADRIATELRPTHHSYAKRQLHPLVLCSPFVYRTFQKPLGYAGDYEMVNMILRDPYEGGSLFAKIVNVCFLQQPPAEAHRNRIKFLQNRLGDETRRVARQGRLARIFNLGCGPAREIQHFLISDDVCDQASFTLLDFNDETLRHTTRILEDIKMRHHRRTPVAMIKKSVHQILKETARPTADLPLGSFDFVYCAGLFDYMSDRICKRLMNFFYDLLAPGGVLIATNVDASKPFRNSMEFILEWHLIYRNRQQLLTLIPDNAPPGSFQVTAETTGVNVFIEVRKPEKI